MNKYIFAGILLAVGSTAFAMGSYTYTEVKGEVITNEYLNTSNQEVFKFKDGLNTCYIVKAKSGANINAPVSTSISCIK